MAFISEFLFMAVIEEAEDIDDKNNNLVPGILNGFTPVMKEDKKMMVMEVKIAALSKLGVKEIRKEEVMAIRTRFPNKVPVIVQKYWKENQLPQLDKSKFLVPQDITMSQFQTIIRNRMHMAQNQALYLLVNERSMLSLSLTLGEIYSEHAGPNGFLYVTYASQEVFGRKTDDNLSIDRNSKIDGMRLKDDKNEENLSGLSLICNGRRSLSSSKCLLGSIFT